MSVMNTYSGRKFDPMKIASEDVYLEDIAHALSLVCRGGGQIRWFYSVGQHSINCAHEALARGWSDRMALACLLHDASECYISDVIRPVKVHLQNYLEIESMIMDAIWSKFHLEDMTDEEFKELLKKRYQVQLSYYKRALMQMTKRPVKEACIYAVSIGQTIFC